MVESIFIHHCVSVLSLDKYDKFSVFSEMQSWQRRGHTLSDSK